MTRGADDGLLLGHMKIIFISLQTDMLITSTPPHSVFPDVIPDADAVSNQNNYGKINIKRTNQLYSSINSYDNLSVKSFIRLVTKILQVW